ncbi:MAG: NUDIX hydrolase [bacterium]|nr:NUDIX hydrolase [bacterium]
MPEKKKERESKDFINLGIVLDKEGKVLLIKRKVEETRNDARLTWAFPGGRQKIHEDRRTCVVREVLKETGYEVNYLREISLRFHPQFPVIVVYSLCQLANPEAAPQPVEEYWEVDEVKWVWPSEIKNFITSNLDPKVAEELGIQS